MHILWLILIGLIAGVIAKFIHRGQTNRLDLSSLRYWASPGLLLPHILDRLLAGIRPIKARASSALWWERSSS